jgi:hypothetical protein
VFNPKHKGAELEYSSLGTVKDTPDMCYSMRYDEPEVCLNLKEVFVVVQFFKLFAWVPSNRANSFTR